MFFRARRIVRHFGLSQTPDVLEIEKMTPFPIKISLRPIKKEEIVESCEETDWVALVSTEEAVSGKIAVQFENDKNEQTPAVTEIYKRVSGRINSFFTEFLQIVRWRNGLSGYHNLIRSSERLEWSLDGITWKPVVRFSTTVHAELYAVRFEPALFDNIKEMLLTEDYEPVSHELLRESWELRAISPRSALMLGISALEVGIKEFIAKIVPPSEWLCFELPAPPAVKMLEEYLPTLPVKLKINGKVFIPGKVIDTLKKAVSKRNRVTHKGASAVNDESLRDILKNIQMTLYFLDYYAGHSWAVNNIRDSDIYEQLVKEFKEASEGC